MSGRCEECGASTVWDQDIGSAICFQCGTLGDPSQSVLVSHLEQADTSGREFAPWANIAGGCTLRGRNGWALAGQSKEARDRKNTISMHDFIHTVAVRLSNPGVTSRAQGAFDQAMRIGQYRWGRKAKLTAGAALAIALRESHKSDSIRDIAYLLDEPPSAVSRAFSRVVQLLQLKLSSADPATHLPLLQTHLVFLLDDGNQDHATDNTTLPGQLVKILVPLVKQLPSIARTATALSELLVRTHILAHVPTAPTACALFMLAIEAELSSSLPNAGALSQALGSRFGVGKVVVMQRYKQIYDLVEEWIREVPWLDAHERKATQGREGGGRSKVAKRVVVARGLKDVVQFQGEIWRKRVESQGRPFIQLDVDDKDGDESGDEWDGSEHVSRSSTTPSAVGEDGSRRKKAKTRHPRPVVNASHFLLNPLSSSGVSVPSSSSSPPGQPDLLTHLLTVDASSLPHAFSHAPTRLQLLATTRGGADEQHIPDDELFTEGELEGLIRSAQEAEIVRVAMGWDAHSSEREDVGTPQRPFGATEGKGKKRKRQSYPTEPDDSHGTAKTGIRHGSKKINMDALARFLDPDADLDADCIPKEYTSPGDIADEDSGDEQVTSPCDYPETSHSCYGGDGEEGNFQSPVEGVAGEIVEEWRPMSPGGGGFVEDWYDLS